MPFRSHMDAALDAARHAANRGETPVGAVIVDPKTGAIMASEGNRVREYADPLAHAEILAIRSACATLGRERLDGLDLYVTLEPCPMCAGAIALARLARVYFGASDPKTGGVTVGARVFSHPQCHHKPEIYSGIAEAECARLLTAFFQARR